MELILILARLSPANAPEPPAQRGHTARSDALRVLRDFDRLAGLPAAQQRAIWRLNADLIREARQRPALARRPGDGDAA